jgi:hypothetical protein
MQIRLSPLFVLSSAFGALCIHRITAAEILNNRLNNMQHLTV